MKTFVYYIQETNKNYTVNSIKKCSIKNYRTVGGIKEFILKIFSLYGTKKAKLKDYMMIGNAYINVSDQEGKTYIVFGNGLFEGNILLEDNQIKAKDIDLFS